LVYSVIKVLTFKNVFTFSSSHNKRFCELLRSSAIIIPPQGLGDDDEKQKPPVWEAKRYELILGLGYLGITKTQFVVFGVMFKSIWRHAPMGTSPSGVI
jgi:hypothetical protein